MRNNTTISVCLQIFYLKIRLSSVLEQFTRSTKKFALLGCFVVFLPVVSYAQITGSVFRDFDGDGTRDTNEPLLSGITVTAYGTTGTSCGTATTSGNTAPNYSLSGCGTGNVRVEFTLPTSGLCVNSSVDYSSLKGSTYGSSVQFVNGNSTGVNFAVYNPGNYNTGPTNTSVVIPVHTNGNPSASGTSQSDDWIVGFPYNNAGTTAPAQKLNGAAVGATWGVAYSRQAGKVFTAAFIKRHVGLGVLGSGGIYMLTPTATSFTVSNFFDMDNPTNALLATTSAVTEAPTRCATGCPAYGTGTSFNIVSNAEATYLGTNDTPTGQPKGLGVVGTNTQRGLPTDKTQPSRDPAAMDQVGKVGLGDIDISDDGQYLFVTNLYDRKLYRLTLDSPTNPTKVTAIDSYNMPSATATNGVLRPFATKFYRGKVYLGAVATGEAVTDDSNADLYAYVFQLDNPMGSASFVSTPVITHRLNYTRGSPNTGSSYTGADRWYPWSKNNYDFFNIARPSPMLTDIEFTDRGDMVMAFTDRFGHQYGHQNYRFLGNPGYNDLVTAQVAGDLIVAGVNCTTNGYTMESNGSFSSSGVTFNGGVGNGQGPGGGEFFDEENQNTTHTETSQGAVGVLFGQAQLMLTNMNPTTSIFSGGTKLMSTTDGASSNSYVLYNQNATGDFGKANGLGDIEFIVPESPIEIGNRVWLDTDANGVQDAGEAGISGVQVQLLKGTTVLATATTDTNGNYYFTSATGTDTASIKYGLTQLMPNMAYTVRFPTTTTVTGTTYNLTTANSTVGAGVDDLIDSDAATSGDISILTTDIPASGANNHSFDVGYSATACTNPTFTLGTTPATCDPTTGNPLNNAQLNLTAISTGADKAAQNTGSTYSGTPDYSTATAITPPTHNFTGLANPTTTQAYTVRVFDGDNACFADQTVTLNGTTDVSSTATITGTNPTCSGATVNPDGKVTLTNFGGTDKYSYTTGASYTGSDTYATATTIPVDGMVTVIPQPANNATQQYTFRIFNAAGCFRDVTTSLSAACSTTCSINTPTVNVTCSDNGTPAITTDDTFTFTINATGTSTGATYKVDKTAPAPASTPFASVTYGTISASSAAFPISGGNLTLTLTDNTTATCTLTNVNVPAPAPCSTPPVGQPDLELTKTADKASVISGNTLTYTLTLRNIGTADATGVKVRDLLPAGLTYVSSVPAQGTYTVATGIWDVGTVAQGATLTLTITVTVN